MHEMALAESVVRIVEDQARVHDYARVKTVWLEIGQLSHAEPDAIRFCFDAVAKGTMMEGAALEIGRTPGKAWCDACGASVAVSSLADACPDCGGFGLRVTEGDELKVCKLEVD